MIDACPDSAVLFFDVDGTLTSFDLSLIHI